MEELPLVYHYDRCDFFFLSIGRASRCQITGEPQLPDGFSTFDPPPIFDTDAEQIAVFLPIEERWEIHPNNFWTPVINEYLVNLQHTMDGQINFRQYSLNQLCRFPGIPRVLYPVKHAMALSARLIYMERRLQEVVNADKFRRQGMIITMETHFYEKFTTEEIILNMKRVIDEIFMNEWVRLEGNSPQFLQDHLIRVCEIQDINKLPTGPTKSHLVEMRDEDPEFFQVLTDLRNSFVHHFPVAETYSLMGRDRPTVNTLHVPKGKLNEMRLITVCLEDLVKSFNRFLVRIFGQ